MRVVVEGLAHRFPGTDLLFEHLDFVAEPGSTIAVCGPSGCGKSTLLSILAGWEKPYAGTVTREGVNRVGWVFQNPYGVAERTALDHVVFPLLAKGMRRKEAELKALEAMGLFDLEYAADRRFSDLSGGEAQRLMLARAVCSQIHDQDGYRNAGQKPELRHLPRCLHKDAEQQQKHRVDRIPPPACCTLGQEEQI